MRLYLIIGGILLTIFVGFGLTIKYLNHKNDKLQTKVEELESDKNELKGSLMSALSANEDNVISLNKCEEANEKLLKHNAQNIAKAREAKEQYDQRLIDIRKKYEQAKNTPILDDPGNAIISDDVDRVLKQTRGGR